MQKSQGDRGQRGKQRQLMKLMLNMEKRRHTCRRAGNKVCGERAVVFPQQQQQSCGFYEEQMFTP